MHSDFVCDKEKYFLFVQNTKVLGIGEILWKIADKSWGFKNFTVLRFFHEL